MPRATLDNHKMLTDLYEENNFIDLIFKAMVIIVKLYHVGLEQMF